MEIQYTKPTLPFMTLVMNYIKRTQSAVVCLSKNSPPNHCLPTHKTITIPPPSDPIPSQQSPHRSPKFTLPSHKAPYPTTTVTPSISARRCVPPHLRASVKCGVHGDAPGPGTGDGAGRGGAMCGCGCGWVEFDCVVQVQGLRRGLRRGGRRVVPGVGRVG